MSRLLHDVRPGKEAPGIAIANRLAPPVARKDKMIQDTTIYEQFVGLQDQR
jgi:hypothetical protein